LESFFDYFSPDQAQAVKQSVLLNDSIQQITTPYMQFLCPGSPLRHGRANPCAPGNQRLLGRHAARGRHDLLGKNTTLPNPARKIMPCTAGPSGAAFVMHGEQALSTCWVNTTWASVRSRLGYATYSVEPVLGGLEWMEGAVPTPHGNVGVYCSKTRIRVKAATGQGVFAFQKPVQAGL
jgi:alpha-L-rhamnosidase